MNSGAAESDRGGPEAIASLRHVERARAPLSFAQEWLWLMEKRGFMGPMWTIAIALHMHGPLDVGELDESLELLVTRHGSLRTRIGSVDGRRIQLIDAPTPGARLAIVDLCRDEATDNRDEGVRCWVQEEIARPFELMRGPLLRALLLRVSDREHVLLLCMHRLICDERSAEIFLRELSELYRARAQGRSAVLAELPVQFADFAVWQREWLQGEELQRQLRYWRQQLMELPVMFDRPNDRPLTRSRPAKVAFHYPSQLLEGLVRVSRQENATLFMTLTAAYQVLLMSWSGQRDIAVVTPVAGRRGNGLEGLIGPFISHLALRTQVSPQESFQVLLARVKETVIGAHAHQDLPFEKLVEELQPLLQARVSLQGESDERLDLPNLTISRIVSESGPSGFDLSLRLVETAQGLSGAFEYATDLFERATIEDLAPRFRALLEGIVAAPDTPIAQLCLPEATEREWQGLLAGADHDQSLAMDLPQVTAEYVAARTPVEEALVRIWSEVLQVPRVGVQDNFFELGGGHSILAMQMIARVREVFEVEIQIGVLFQAPSVEKLAECLAESLERPSV